MFVTTYTRVVQELSNSFDISLFETLRASIISHTKGMFLTRLFLVSIDLDTKKRDYLFEEMAFM